MKKALALILILALCCGVLSGCGASQSATEGAEAAVSAASVQDAPAEAQSEPDTADSALPEETQDSTTEETPADAVYGSYCMANPDLTPFPANDGTTISFWTTMPVGLLGLQSSADITAWRMLSEISGYQLEFIDANTESAATNFMLMAAANDFTDVVCSAVTYYVGGGGAAIEDHMIIDFADYIADYIPNLQALMDENPDLIRDVTTDDGYIPGVFTVANRPDFADTGYSIRQDQLDALGLAVPETYDEVYDVLKAFQNAGYGGLALGSSGVSIQNNMLSGYGVYGEYTSVMGANYPFYVDNGQIKYGHMEEGFREYLEMMAKWYAEGLVYSDFVSVGMSMSTDTDLILNNDVSIFYSEAAVLVTIQDAGASVDENFQAQPMPMTLREKGSTEYYTTYPTITSNSWSIAANSEVIYETLELFNFMYSDEGSLISNYGEENYTYVVNDDGSYSYTDLILDHELGMRMGMMAHVMMGGPFKCDVMRMVNAYEPLAYTASVDYWTMPATEITSIPPGVSLTTAESEEVANILSDIMTYAGTMITKYIMGDESMDHYDVFITTMENMGIQDAIDIYQGAYDRYLFK